MPEWAIGVAIIILAASARGAFPGLIRAMADRISRRTGSSPAAESETQKQIEGLQTRMGELEERLDFTERMLARYRESGRLQQPPK